MYRMWLTGSCSGLCDDACRCLAANGAGCFRCVAAASQTSPGRGRWSATQPAADVRFTEGANGGGWRGGTPLAVLDALPA